LGVKNIYQGRLVLGLRQRQLYEIGKSFTFSTFEKTPKRKRGEKIVIEKRR